VVAHQTLERLAREERGVSRQDEDRALTADRARLEDRVAGAEALALLDDGDALARRGANAIGGRPDDEDDPVCERPYASSGRPQSGWRTLGWRERIRLPSPAARMTIVRSFIGAPSFYRTRPQSPCHSESRPNPRIYPRSPCQLWKI
jgi:hypothetical protein